MATPRFLIERAKANIGIQPQLLSGTTEVSGDTIDRRGFASLLASFWTGATSGTPDSFTVTGKLYHGDASNMSDEADTGLSFTVLTAADAIAKKYIDLTPYKRYIRLKVTPAFVGGTSPKVNCAGSIVIGDATVEPV